MSTAARSKRCWSMNPTVPDVRCIHLERTAHTTHAGWSGDIRLEWRDAPAGPQTEDEWRAAAWAFTDGLGIKIYYDPGDICLRVDHTAVCEWWDAFDGKNDLVTRFRASRDNA